MKEIAKKTEKTEIIKLNTKGGRYPTGKEVLDASMSYFNTYMVMDKGLIEFTDEGINKISDAGMFNALGITRRQWEAWKHSRDNHKNDLRRAVEIVEQIFEQVDMERLARRGNAGDIFRMKAKYNWQQDEGKKVKPLQEVSTDRVAAILSRMTKNEQ